MADVQLFNPQTGEVFDVDESEAQDAIRVNKLQPATPAQVAQYDEEQNANLRAEATPISSRLKIPIDVATGKFATAVEGASTLLGKTGFGSAPGLAGNEEGQVGYSDSESSVIGKQQVAPEAFSEDARARARTYPGVQLASDVATDAALAAALPGGAATSLAGKVAGFAGRAAVFGSAAEAEQSRIMDDEFSASDAMFMGLLGETFSSLASFGARKIFRGASEVGGEALEQETKKAVEEGTADALGEIDPALRNEKVAAYQAPIVTKASDDLAQALEHIEDTVIKSDDKAFTPANLKKTVLNNAAAQEDSLLSHAVDLDDVAKSLKSGLPEESAFGKLMTEKLDDLMSGPTNPAKMFGKARQMAVELADQMPANLAPEARKIVDDFVMGLKNENVWGKAAKNFAESDQLLPKVAGFRDALFDAEAGTINKNALKEIFGGKLDKTALEGLLDSAQTLQSVIKNKKLGQSLKVARAALELGTEAHSSQFLKGMSRPISEELLEKGSAWLAKKGTNAARGAVRSAIKTGLRGIGLAKLGPVSFLADPLIDKGVDLLNPVINKYVTADSARAMLNTMSTVRKTLTDTAARATSSPTLARGVQQSIANTRVAMTAGMAAFMGENLSPRAAYQEKREIIQKLQADPNALIEEMTRNYGSLQRVAPGLHRQMVKKTYEVSAFLQSKMPAPVGVSLQNPNGVPPDYLTIRKFGLYYSASTQPRSVIQDVRNGRATQEQMEALKVCWPDDYEDLKMGSFQAMSVSPPTVSQRMRMDTLFDYGAQLDASFSWQLAIAADQAREEKAGKQPSRKPPTRRAQPSTMADVPGGLQALQNPQGLV